jgi:lipid II:glycine glycyltransferase (peptidoglycan interpeptide bridge formation enzyme)
MTIVRGKFILRGDIWFDEKPEKISNLDVLYYYYQMAPPTNLEVEFEEEYTLVLDLTKEQDVLWKTLKKDNRYKIRRAVEKDRVVYEFLEWIDSNILNDFLNFYKQFTLQQGLKSLSKQAISRLESYANAGVLKLSRVKSQAGHPLAWRVYYYSKNRIFPLHSASNRHSTDASYNQMIGRANRYHRWQDILQFKSLGVLLYDFGGLYINTTEQHLLNINDFKEEFGGELVRNFNWRYGITLKGKLFLRLRKLFVSPPSDEEVNSSNRVFPELVSETDR